MLLTQAPGPRAEAFTVIPAETGIQDFSIFWTPAFAGVQKWADTILLELWIRSWLFLSTPVATATHGRTPGSRPGKAGGLPLLWSIAQLRHLRFRT